MSMEQKYFILALLLFFFKKDPIYLELAKKRKVYENSVPGFIYINKAKGHKITMISFLLWKNYCERNFEVRKTERIHHVCPSRKCIQGKCFCVYVDEESSI